MGMSASQGRMLLLTARKSDLEFRAQQISQKRLILAQQLEEISQDYEDATSNRQMKINLYGTDGEDDSYGGKFRNLTYAALVSGTINNVGNDVSGIQPGKNTKNHTDLQSNKFFRLTNVDGAIVVSDIDEIPGSYTKTTIEKSSKVIPSEGSELNTILNGEGVTGRAVGGYGTLKNSDGENVDVIELQYSKNGEKHFAYVNASDGSIVEDYIGKEQSPSFKLGESTKNTDDTKYTCTPAVKQDDNGNNYIEIATQTKNTITLAQPVEGTDGKYQIQVGDNWYTYVIDPAIASGSSDAAGDKTGPNYLQDCLRNGKYLIEQGNKDSDEGQFLWKSVSWDAISNINDSYYTEDDDKAKAKYDRLQTQIQNQDKKLELELNNIETQRSAVTTEIESVQKVIDDNVQDSFKVFNA